MFAILKNFLANTAVSIKFRLLLFLFITIATIVLNIVTPLFLVKLIKFLSQRNIPLTYYTSFILVSYGVVWTITRIIDQCRTLLLGRIAWRAATYLSQMVFNKLLELPLAFHVQKKIGEILAQIQKAETAISNLIWQLAIYIIPTLLEIILAASILYYYYGFYYAVGLSATLSLYLIFTLLTVQYSVKAQNQSRKIANESYGQIGDILLNYETVKLFNNEALEKQRCQQFLQQREDALTKRMLAAETIMLGQKIIIGTGLILLNLYAAKGVMHGQLHIADFILINSYVLQFYNPLSAMAAILREITSALGEMKDVQYILSLPTPTQITPSADTVLKSYSHSSLVIFDKVKFRYGERLILNNISFALPTGKKTVIVGASGAGKTTLIKLLFRFYEISGGHLFFNGQAINTIPLSTLRNKVSVVPQDIVLFNDSLYYNLSYGNPTATFADIERVVKLVNLEHFIQHLPDQYATLVGERGMQISGGERQRIGIARALLKNPVLLIFDEATAALDTTTEYSILQQLTTIICGITTLFITHRLALARDADQILVLNNGTIVEGGRHLELLAKGGYYKTLWDQQNQHSRGIS